MKRYLFCFLMLNATILIAQTLAPQPSPSIGEQFYDEYNSISLNARSYNGIEWIVVNNMRGGILKVTFTAQGGGQSANESATLNGYNSFKQGSLGKNLIGDNSLIEYTVSGTATSNNIPSNQSGNIGYIAVSYYGEGT